MYWDPNVWSTEAGGGRPCMAVGPPSRSDLPQGASAALSPDVTHVTDTTVEVVLTLLLVYDIPVCTSTQALKSPDIFY